MESKYSYRFTEKAEQDLDDILHHLSFDLANPVAAQNLGRKIFEQIDTVCAFPDSGAPVSNEFVLDKTVRKLSVDQYILYYKAHHDNKIFCRLYLSAQPAFVETSFTAPIRLDMV